MLRKIFNFAADHHEKAAIFAVHVVIVGTAGYFLGAPTLAAAAVIGLKSAFGAVAGGMILGSAGLKLGKYLARNDLPEAKDTKAIAIASVGAVAGYLGGAIGVPVLL